MPLKKQAFMILKIKLGVFGLGGQKITFPKTVTELNPKIHLCFSCDVLCWMP